MNTPTVIAFAGIAGAGKTTAAQYLVDSHGFVKVSFADPLRKMLSCLTDVEDRYDARKNEPRLELCGKSLRQAMQTLGTEWGRYMVGEMLWTTQLVRTVHRLGTQGVTRIVVDDCRFDNEAQTICSGVGGRVYQIIRPGHAPAAPAHASETGVSGPFISGTVVNITDDVALSVRLEEIVRKTCSPL